MGATVCRGGDRRARPRARRGGRPAARRDRLGSARRARHPRSRVAPRRTRCADAGAEVAVDFTVIDAARENIVWCAEQRCARGRRHHRFLRCRARRARESGSIAPTANAVIAPNFAIGAILMMRFAEMAAPYFESCRDHRAPPRSEDRRAVGHRGAHRAANGRGFEGMGRRPDHEGGRAERAWR